MKKKLLDLLEQHVDKLILGVIGILSLAILWMFVIGSPYAVKYGNKKAGPGQIDKLIRNDAARLDETLKGPTTEETMVYSGDRMREYIDALASNDINENVFIPMPGSGIVVVDDRSYKKPTIPAVTEIAAELLRTAYFVPTEKLDEDTTYDTVTKEPGDLDLVSVQASLDISSLYKSFQKCFDGLSVSPEFRDEKLAVPVFAAVELQRQQKLENGNWTAWADVERTKIDRYRDIFNVPQKIEDVELGGIDLMIMNFREPQIQFGLLQPLAYDVAASNANWLPPVLHKEMIKLLEEQEVAKIRESRSKNRLRSEDGFSRQSSGRIRQASRVDPDQRTLQVIEGDYMYMTLTEEVDLSTMSELLTVWAHDDTAESSNTYRYRIRVGLFNPTAGKGWFKGADAAYKDDVVLWTEYSDVSEEIVIEPKMYLFPLKVSRDNDKLATIQVSKFYNGKWQSHEFDIAVGDAIGENVTIEPESTGTSRNTGSAGFYNRRRYAAELETIDFTTGAVLVDIVQSKQSSSGYSRTYQEILYTADGQTIEHVGVGKRSWPKGMMKTFDRIEEDKDLEVTLSGSSIKAGRTFGEESEYDDEDEEFDEY